MKLKYHYLCLISILSLGLLTACSKAPKADLPANLQIIEDFDATESWTSFAAPNSSMKITTDEKEKYNGNSSMAMSFDIKDWGGVGSSFKDKKQWNPSDSLFFVLKGDSSGKTLMVEITDNGGERFATAFPVNFTGWKAFTIPFKDFKRRDDWQPDNVPNDGLTLTAVEGLSFSPKDKSNGTWNVDTIGIIQGK
ncbi:MAG: hypothetical protein DKM50_01390 [Candidatus Margulisiibacteriota bacterium]|nr:MAG: hypothetical protein A2X43_08425 [Candidatus Margulisbacteria bacterium GWD2_39_127]OGI01279.1 MAG: hypothetical protein A2X42_05965 [Candidatus Margulisbacteria bacterium GWF2_38_17]OGI09223.1 MAG: hypothetical protein A2X41_01450 [Candidatus Margulisbacteria bacterium GWE2_39_32]PZM83756.1 MAG: hypothetical protein DKM50_01390 [Candidatus Margulisiibacteriota bacterium]HAR63052.1 hypothetical protein [Candidatus Margulisiibacteriota bacterium]